MAGDTEALALWCTVKGRKVLIGRVSQLRVNARKGRHSHTWETGEAKWRLCGEGRSRLGMRSCAGRVMSTRRGPEEGGVGGLSQGTKEVGVAATVREDTVGDSIRRGGGRKSKTGWFSIGDR